MKKYFIFAALRIFAALAIMAPLMVSCGSNGPTADPNPGSNPGSNGGSSANEVLSPNEQKEYLEKVALEFKDAIPSSDFKKIKDLEEYISETYGEDYDWEAVGEWAEELFDASRKALGTQTTERNSENWGGYTYSYLYVYTNYKAVLLASNFVGHFTAKNGGWQLTKADDLQFIFKDQSGKECVIKLETSGDVKKVHVGDMDEWTGYESHNMGSTEYYDRTQCTIGVPEHIVVTLTQGGNQVIKTSIKIDLGGITNEEFDISKGRLNLSVVTELNNGYKFDVKQMAYNANKNVAASFVISKDGKSLVTAVATSDILGEIPSSNIVEITSGDSDVDLDLDEMNAKNVNVKLDILGKVQLQGKLTDAQKFANYLEEAYDNDDSESKFKSYINQANSLADINLYYNGTSTKQATVKFEPFMEESYSGKHWWIAEPVLYFNDGSSYSTFDAFFNEIDFKNTIDAFEALIEKYADLLDID